MATIRLNNEHRHYLRGIMSTTVSCPEEEKAKDKAYAKVRPLVVKVVETKYPPQDMEVLLKYQHVNPAWTPRMQLTAGGVVQFHFTEWSNDSRKPQPNPKETKEMGVPLVPGTDWTHWNYHQNTIFAADDKVTAAYNEYVAAKDAFDKCITQKYRDYDALITAATTVEQIEEVWPDAGALLRKRVEATLPVVLSDDVMARIRADAKTRKKTETVDVSPDFVRRPPRTVRKTVERVDEEFVSRDDFSDGN